MKRVTQVAVSLVLVSAVYPAAVVAEPSSKFHYDRLAAADDAAVRQFNNDQVRETMTLCPAALADICVIAEDPLGLPVAAGVGQVSTAGKPANAATTKCPWDARLESGDGTMTGSLHAYCTKPSFGYAEIYLDFQDRTDHQFYTIDHDGPSTKSARPNHDAFWYTHKGCNVRVNYRLHGAVEFETPEGSTPTSAFVESLHCSKGN